MRKIFLVMAIAALFAVEVFALDMYVIPDTLNVRKGPSADTALVGQLTKGTRVQVLESSGQWYKIKSGKIEGYANSQYLTSDSGKQADKKTSNDNRKSVNNYISGEVSIFGGGARYERMLNDRISIGANAYYNTLILWNEVEAGFSFRFYIARFFFIGTGVGFHIHTGWYDYGSSYWYDDVWAAMYGVAISPEIGFKIDPGDKGGFFIQPGVKVPITFGWLENYYSLINYDNIFRVGWGVVPYVGLGFAW